MPIIGLGTAGTIGRTARERGERGRQGLISHSHAKSGTGAIAYSTYLGGSGNEQASGIAVDGQGDAYVTGETAAADYRLPTTVPALQVSGIMATAGVTSVVTSPVSVTVPPTGADVFVTTLGPTGMISYSARLRSLDGVNAVGDTWGRAVAVDSRGETYVTGRPTRRTTR